MKTLVTLMLSGLVLGGCTLVEQAPPPPPPASGIGFVASCDMPTGSLVSRGKGDDSHYSFSLNDRDLGGCKDDNRGGQRAPYWERAELRQQGHLNLAEPMVVKFDARFRHGFSGKQESFFQIHNYNASCPAGPSLMMKWHRGQLELSILQESGILKPKRYPERMVKAHRSWSTWQVRMARKSKTELAIDVLNEGKRIGRGHVAYVAECGTPYVKFGIYRPGNTWDENETSLVEFRKFSLKSLNPPKPMRAAGPVMLRKSPKSLNDLKPAEPPGPTMKRRKPKSLTELKPAAPSVPTMTRKKPKALKFLKPVEAEETAKEPES